ncbi:glycosyltransferase [Streptococcus iniae]
MINPKISVIVPVYNAEKTISKCIQSLLEQTFQEFELILVNDGSKDNSLQLLKEFEEHHSNFKVIDQVNGGASIARNTGLDAASGDYIVFVDIDDYLDSDYLDVLYQEIVKTGNDIVISSLRMVDNQGKVVSQIVLDDTSGDNWSQYIITTPYTRIFKRLS